MRVFGGGQAVDDGKYIHVPTMWCALKLSLHLVLLFGVLPYIYFTKTRESNNHRFLIPLVD